jgi:hypothetical protein
MRQLRFDVDRPRDLVGYDRTADLEPDADRDDATQFSES